MFFEAKPRGALRVEGKNTPVGQVIKDDSQSVLRSRSTLMFMNIYKARSMECESMLFVTSHIPYLRGFSNSFWQDFRITPYINHVYSSLFN